MKFSKHLSVLIEIIKETIPDWRDKFVSYKDLKKWLNRFYLNDDLDTRPNKRPRLNDEMEGGDLEEQEEEKMISFEELLEKEIDKLNAFFLDKQQDYVIGLKLLRERVAESGNSSEELMREIVDFHGQMVLLANYSALNYLGIVKFSKKYYKQRGVLIPLPFIRRIQQEPFYRTDILSRLVKDCESMLLSISASHDTLEDEEDPDNKVGTDSKEKLKRVFEALARTGNMENIYVRLTESAFRVMKDIRNGSSTRNQYSLPPM